MPFEEFRVLCSETVTGKLKKVVVLRRFSVCDLRFVSTRSVLFFNFFTDFGIPIIASICFSITKGESEVIGFSQSSDLIIKNLAKFSVDLKNVELAVSSSESGLCRLLVEPDGKTGLGVKPRPWPGVGGTKVESFPA